MRINIVRFSGLLFAIFFSFLSGPLVAGEGPGILKIEIAGLKDAEGSVFISIYDSEDTWLGEDVVLMREVDIKSALQEDLVMTEIQLPVGEYAVSIFYDENGNGDLDTNFIGIPKEPIAVSNNAAAKFGPPKYEDARFDLDLEPVIQSINITSL